VADRLTVDAQLDAAQRVGSRHAREDVVPVAQALEHRIRNQAAHDQQFRRVADRERPHHDGVDQAEDRRVRADPERERADCNRGEARIA
jgi:hypothetical protein